jgi:hypothetical protein
MTWVHYVSFFFGAVLLTNAVPHLVSGLMGRPFQSPFAHPPGKGLSSSTVNVLWGWLNIAIGYALLCKVGAFDLRNPSHAGVVGAAVLARSLLAARHFGQFHGGTRPTGTTTDATAPSHAAS